MGGALPAPSGGSEPDPALLEAMRKQYEEEIEANKRAMEEMTVRFFVCGSPFCLGAFTL